MRLINSKKSRAVNSKNWEVIILKKELFGQTTAVNFNKKYLKFLNFNIKTKMKHRKYVGYMKSIL